jgi:hypothetical protein
MITIFGEKLKKINVMIYILHTLAVVLSKNAKFFGDDIFKIVNWSQAHDQLELTKH